ncbi:MAG: cobalamin biosynthesis protein CbiD, partial [Nitrososphaeraceae archaeon]|nr:cobalamin biosynthesis protein CbiD [Nitrososphaeraceae archaeon]
MSLNPNPNINKNSIKDDLELAEIESEQELPLEILEKRRKGQLRTGYTTGTSASAATKAALLTLISSKIFNTIDVSLPKGKIATLPIAWTRTNQDNQSVTCAVIKDGGDDPDVTHGAEICSTVSLTNNKGLIEIDGGIGV